MPKRPVLPRRSTRLGFGAFAFLVGALAPLRAQELPSDLTELSLDDLMQIEVTTVSKRSEPLSQAAGAVFVLTGEEIRRAGSRSIVEALRLVPGLHVARTDVQTQTYAVSARGFNNGLADKLEVLLDGRSVYSPLFSGVFWDTLDTYLPDIDRIEVIRGPGAALWGANAVNGVINIVTKSAAETQGTQVTAGGGTEERAFGALRAGGRLGEAGHVRAYAQAFERGAAALAHSAQAFEGGTPRDPADGMRLSQAGLRADWQAGIAHRYTLMGDVYRGERLSPTGTMDLDGGNVLGRWSWQRATDSELALKVYYDRYHRMIPQAYEETRDTVDLDLNHQLQPASGHDVVYGLGYRNSRDETGGPPRAFIFDPAARRAETFSAFAQDQIELGGGAGALTLGSKFEHNDYTGFEYQPSARLGWQLGERLFTWGAVSRAVRTPNRVNANIAVFCSDALVAAGVCPTPGVRRIGHPEVQSEKLIAYEWGLRFWTAERLSADLALFYNDYSKLQSAEASPPPFGSFGNSLEGTGHGGELDLTWRPSGGVETRLFYSYLKLDLERAPDSTDRGTAQTIEGSNPRHMAGIDFSAQLAPDWTVDGLLRYLGRMPASNVPAYAELNLRLAWQAQPKLEVALVGANLLDAQHPEFGIPNVIPLEAQRSGFLQIHWTWD